MKPMDELCKRCKKLCKQEMGKVWKCKLFVEKEPIDKERKKVKDDG